MRYQGRLTDWKDDKGFGFVTPNGGGQRAFVHIRSFANQQRRPLGNEIITYEVAYDPMGRPQAENIRIFGERKQKIYATGRSSVPLFIAALFLLFVAAAIALGKMPLTVAGFYVPASVITFIAYAIDKSAAQSDRWRTPESTLHMFALACGWPGALAAQYMLRHKSKKASFLSMYWMTVALNVGALLWLLMAAGATGLRTAIGF
jgi:uncharacterized membrane protein YsdA (DUF1294 family)/cold shock CspA family protein